MSGGGRETGNAGAGAWPSGGGTDAGGTGGPGPRALAVGVRAFVDELARAGLRDAVVCPGSRSTPLALALRAHGSIRIHVLLDERVAGFFALGLARTARRPVAVAVTSGTAAAELLPAVVEASLGRVPLLLLTADRPPELRDRGAPQTIDQLHLYGRHAKWFADLPVPDGLPETVRHLRWAAGRAVATALAGPAGPVHVNLPFREPLVPDGQLGPEEVGATDGTQVQPRPFTEVLGTRRLPGPMELEALADRLDHVERGLIVVGPQDDGALPAAVARLAAALDWPVIADALSGLRCGSHERSRIIDRGDLLCRPSSWLDAHRPDLVLRFGAAATSNAVGALEAAAPVHLVVDGEGGFREPAIVPTTFVHADAPSTALALADLFAADRAQTRADRFRPDRSPASSWADEWLAAEHVAERAVRDCLGAFAARGEPFEGEPFRQLADLLPAGSVLWAGNSMPVRDMDTFLPGSGRAIRLVASRGANGIDGTISAAVGSAAAGCGRVAMVVGDLALLHDLGALVAARLHGLDLTIVLVNNDGGGIFSFLPQASASAPGAGLPAAFEELFGTPHGIDPGPLVTALGAVHRPVAPGELRGALAEALGASGVHVVELRTDRARNVVLHREVVTAVTAALDELVSGAARPEAEAGR
ncbi:MAG: 2-succinyl-5-enolpyruvyl-6-hydroxy-3-cyclohexene-1-carboxylic-acid synthase [Chloroflexi bacterium]|nr:2-succinyl-5-enolpyruvyl-6-hydroxy-3-cyclohexene-1-carboxylic-acid synthase [Chloroflexota bacterium]